jgi:hypothetical protein
MGPLTRILITLALLFSGSVPDLRADSKSNSSGEFEECELKCARLTGGDRYQCIRMCVNAKRKNSPGSRNDTKKKMEECESLCAEDEGVDRIKCIRLCMDRKRGTKVKLKEKTGEKENPCENRCGVLTGPMKEKCMAKCERDTKFDARDRDRSRKK